MEFAADIGQGLLIEVRRLQALLSEREEALKAAQLHGSGLERHAENLEARIKSLDESEQRFKDQNWNLELSIQELHSKTAEHKDTETKLQAQIAHMGHEKNMVIKELDEWKHQNGKLYEDLEAEHKHHEYELAAMKKKLANSETDQVELQSTIEELRQQLEESHKASLRLRQLEQRPDREDALKDPFDLQPAEATPENSPPPSPTKQTPRHTMLEAETVRSSLNHAHRMIANLKSSVHREKSEKAELKRLLQDARDELETARSNLGNGPSGSAGKRRKYDGHFRKPVLRPNINANLLGGPRKSKDEVTLIESPGDGDWEEAHDGPVTPNAQASHPSEQTRSPSGMDYDRDGTDAFETADEQGANATETEAYKTGNESPMADYPTSADELTETEANPQDLKTKSHTSSFGMRPLRPGKFRHRDSVASATSTEDDDDSRRRYASFGAGSEDGLGGQHHGIMGALHSGSSRLKLRVSKFRGRGTRVASESSLFSNRPLSAGSNSAGGSPASLNPQLSTPGERKSLFAELGDSPMIGTDDGEDEYEYIEPETPTKSFIRPTQMVDCSIMTEEPYPEQFFLRTPEEHERPKTAVTIKDAPPTTSVGVQSTPEPEATVQMTDAAVQSLAEPRAVVSEMGTQSDEIPPPQVAEAGTQFDQEFVGGDTILPTPVPVAVPDVNKTAIKREMKDSGTQFVPELEKVEKKGFSVGFPVSFPSIRRSATTATRPVKEMRSVETQFDPELESAILAQETGATPAVPLEFSGIHSQDTIPVDHPAPVEPALVSAPVPAPVPGADESALSDEGTPKKVSETVEEAQQRSTTPSPTAGVERPGLWGAVFSWRRGGSITSKPGTPVSGNERPATGEPPAESQPTPDIPINLGKIPEPPAESQPTPDIPTDPGKIPEQPTESQPTPDIPTDPGKIPEPPTESKPTSDIPINLGKISEQPQLPKAVPMLDQTVQTDISSDFFDEVLKRAEKPIDKGKRPAYMVSTSQISINGDKSSARTTSLRSGPSLESISRTGIRAVGAGLAGGEAARSQSGSIPKRPGSASSQRDARVARPPLPPDHKEHIAAAQQKGVTLYEPGAMGPPPVPTTRTNVAFRPKTPVHDRISRESETPGSRGGTTPRPKFSTSRSEVSSPTSRRSSMSSFASELDERFDMKAQNNGGPSARENPTDPRMIQAITQTMIGEYLWKYTRNPGRSNSRHKRFIWVHPYTRTLYWSKWDPTSAGRNELRTKSVAIEALRVVTDDNPLPPGLHRKSLVIITPGKSLKFTAPTSQRHETWFNVRTLVNHSLRLY